MIVEACRMLKTWFQDGTNGISAMMVLIPTQSGDTIPALANIVEETTDESTASESGLPKDAPAVGISVRLVTEQPDQAVNDMGDGTLEVLIRYLTRERNAAKATQDASYTLRAVIWSLRKFHAGVNDPNRVLRGIQLIQTQDIKMASLFQSLGDGFATGAITVRYQYRDYQLP